MTGRPAPAPGEPVVVGILYPPVWHGEEALAAEIDALRALDPRVEVLVAPYVEPDELRTARSTGAEPPAGAAPPALDDSQRAALARVHVVMAIDLPREVGSLAPRLGWVQAIGAGTGQLEVDRLAAEGIRLTSNGGANGIGIAEFVIGRILQWAKRFDEIDAAQLDHRWDPHFGIELAGSTIGLVGYGGINTAVAARAAAFGMTVLVLRARPGVDPEPPVEAVFGPGQLEELLAASDVVVAAVPDTADTRGMFGAAAFAAMRPGAFLVNVGRGTLVDEAALRDALSTGRLGGAALDVASREPLPADDPLWDAPNLHLSADCSTSPQAMFPHVHRLLRENLRRYLDGEPLRHEVLPERGY